MNKCVFLFDGFNLYHSIDSNRSFQRYKWLNLRRLAELFITKQDQIENIYYFTALTTWSKDKMRRHKLFIKALELENIDIVYGEFRRSNKKCAVYKKTYYTYEEKRTDVNIAITLFRLAIQDKFDKAYIVSGDSDLIPSIQAVQNLFPNKKVGVIIPIGRRAELLKQVCDFYMKIKEKHLRASLFEKQIDIGKGEKISCPSQWC